MTQATDKAGLIERAIDGVGRHDGSDWKLKPSEHRARLPEKGFEGLKNILNQPALLQLMTEFELSDANAVANQTRYKNRMRLRALLLFLSLAIGAASLFPAHGAVPELWGELGTWLQSGAIISATFIAVTNFWSNPLRAWQQARNSAELARGSFFHQILEADVSADFAAGKAEAELPLTLQKLEYIRRYHIELQYAYYCGRGRQHAASDKTKQLMLWLSGGLILIAAIPTAHLALQWIGIDLRGLPFLSNLSDALRFNLVWLGTAFVAINIIAISLQSSIEKTFRINNDAANARRYHETAKRLSRLYRNHLPRLRRQAADDNLQPLRRWFTCCNYIILDEHLQWRREAAAVTDSLDDVNALAQAVHPTMPQK